MYSTVLSPQMDDILCTSISATQSEHFPAETFVRILKNIL